MTILIIEDEIKTARELKRDIEALGQDLIVLETLQGVRSSVKWLRDNPAPDLILSDIQLADGLSFEIFRQIEVASPIIFCTAFDEYAIEAFRTSSIDYLLKPVDAGKLRESLGKFRRMKSLFNPESPAQKMETLLSNLASDYKKTLLVHFQDKIVPVAVSDIAYLHYEFGNVSLFTFDRKKYAMAQSMDELEKQLSPRDFFRINRQFIVSRNSVDVMANYFSRRLLLKLSVPVNEEVVVSKIKSPLFLKWMER